MTARSRHSNQMSQTARIPQSLRITLGGDAGRVVDHGRGCQDPWNQPFHHRSLCRGRNPGGPALAWPPLAHPSRGRGEAASSRPGPGGRLRAANLRPRTSLSGCPTRCAPLRWELLLETTRSPLSSSALTVTESENCTATGMRVGLGNGRLKYFVQVIVATASVGRPRPRTNWRQFGVVERDSLKEPSLDLTRRYATEDSQGMQSRCCVVRRGSIDEKSLQQRLHSGSIRPATPLHIVGRQPRVEIEQIPVLCHDTHGVWV